MRTLTRRAIPTQARSTVTVEKILTAATKVLAERGLQGLNTNAVAESAQINVATLYHYFPDKVAIMAELFIRDQAQRSEYLVARFTELPDVVDIDTWTTDLINSIMDLRRANPETNILRQACRTVPELLALEESDTAQISDTLARALRLRFPMLSVSRSGFAARALVESVAVMLDRASSDEMSSSGLIREIITMVTAYLERLDATK
jgi:AcrR family transcriptional regulator